MLRVCINCYGVTTSDSVYQWDLNHTLAISGADTSKAIAIHFCNKKSTEAIVVPTTIDGDVVTAPIPNILLQEPHNVIAYLHITDSILNEAKTVETINIPVIARVKPSEYEFEENIEIPTYEQLDARFNEYVARNDEKFEEFKNEIDDKLATGNFEKLDNHIEDTNNPHQVTKDQVGLDKVDNTSDMDKPVSYKQSEAIENARLSSIEGAVYSLVKPWDMSQHYEGDLRSYEGLTYRATRPGGGEDLDTAWEQVYLSDVIEEQQIAIDNAIPESVGHVVTPWINTSYAKGQIVSHKGMIYICLKTPTYIEPDFESETALEYWEPTTLSSIVENHIETASETIRGELTKANVTDALGYTPPTTNTTYGVATTSANGLMSSSDKTKLTAIGTILSVSPSAVSCSSQSGGTGTEIAGLEFPAGTYFVTCAVHFPAYSSSAGSYRRATLSTTSGKIDASKGVSMISSPINNQTTMVHIGTIIKVTSATVYYLNAQHNSSESLSVSGQIKAVRIA